MENPTTVYIKSLAPQIIERYNYQAKIRGLTLSQYVRSVLVNYDASFHQYNQYQIREEKLIGFSHQRALVTHPHTLTRNENQNEAENPDFVEINETSTNNSSLTVEELGL